MNRSEEILTILQEECAEVIQAVSKIKRFGMFHNMENLHKELADLQCMIDLSYEYILVSADPADIDAALGTFFTWIGRNWVGRGRREHSSHGLGGTGWVGVQLQLSLIVQLQLSLILQHDAAKLMHLHLI